MVDIVMLLYMVLLQEFLQKKVAFAMVWKDGKAEIAFKNKNVSQVGQSRKQTNPAFQLNSKRFQQGSRTVPVFRGVHFRVTSPRPQRLKPNRFAVGN